MMSPAARLLITAFAFLSWLGIGVAADWQPVELKFPKIADPEALNITAIGISSPDLVYIATSDGRFYLRRGKTLEEIKHDESGNSAWVIRNIVVIGADQAWALGDNGLSLRFDGKRWQPVRNPLTGTGKGAASLWAAGCAKPDLCFAGSRSGRLIQWDGRRWEEVSSPVKDTRIYGLELVSPDFGWMVGDGFLASWDGKKWTKAELERISGVEKVLRMYDLALFGRDRGWAVGDRGVFLKYNGKTWSRSDVKGSLFRLRSIACTAKPECWAVGEAGTVFGWNGADWRRVRVGTVNRLTTVRVAPGIQLIGGDKSTLLELAE